MKSVKHLALINVGIYSNAHKTVSTDFVMSIIENEIWDAVTTNVWTNVHARILQDIYKK